MASSARRPVRATSGRSGKPNSTARGTRRTRRTQAERRATTRAALLDAVLACLVEDGYANLTTRRVAARAGVSQGTQQHYFASKSEFVAETMRYAAQKISGDVLKRIDIRDFRNPERQGALLDELWAVHKSPAFKAALELWIAARSDQDLRREMRKLEREVTAIIGAATRAVLPEEDRDPEFLEMIDIGLAAVRGFAMLAPVVPQAELDRRWAVARDHLVNALQAGVSGIHERHEASAG